MVNAKKLYTILFYITMITIFLPTCAFRFGSKILEIAYITVLSFWGIYIPFNLKPLYNYLIYIWKTTPFKYYIYILLYIHISNIFVGLSPLNAISRTIFYYIPFYCLSVYFIPKLIPIKHFIKFFIIILFFIVIYGYFQFIADTFHISFLITIKNIINNYRILTHNGIYEGYNRLHSVFGEPAELGGFLFVIFPTIYISSFSKNRLFNNSYLNFIHKKLLIPALWSCLLLTFSPIWIPACIIQALLFYRKKIAKIFTNLRFFILSCCVIIICILLLSGYMALLKTHKGSEIKSPIDRITTSVNSFTSIERLMTYENSFAMRVIASVERFHVFTKHPIWGYRLPDTKHKTNNDFIKITQQRANAPIPIGSSLAYILGYAEIPKLELTDLFEFLEEFGLVGTGLIIYCILMNIKYLRFLKNNIKDTTVRNFAYGYELSLWMVLVRFFYESVETEFYFFLFGISCSLCLYYYQEKAKLAKLENVENPIELTPCTQIQTCSNKTT